jgi:hypothetical protein
MRSLVARARSSSVCSHRNFRKDELAKNRQELAEALYNYKERLGGTGRDGIWAPFLRKNGISKTTADRYVQQHKGLLNPVQKLLSRELILTAEQIDKLAARVSRGLAKVLVKPDSISIFLEALARSAITPSRQALRGHNPETACCGPSACVCC